MRAPRVPRQGRVKANHRTPIPIKLVPLRQTGYHLLHHPVNLPVNSRLVVGGLRRLHRSTRPIFRNIRQSANLSRLNAPFGKPEGGNEVYRDEEHKQRVQHRNLTPKSAYLVVVFYLVVAEITDDSACLVTEETPSDCRNCSSLERAGSSPDLFSQVSICF